MNRLFIKPSELGLISEYEDEIYVVCKYPKVKTGMYFISNYGNVYSRLSNRLLTKTVTETGYYRIILQIEKSLDDKNRHQLTFKVHRLVAYEFCYKDSILKTDVDHLDCNTINNYYKNLEWVTSTENTRRITERGRNYHKSSEEFIRKLCKKMEDNETIFDIYYEYHPDEEKIYQKFQDDKFYTFLYLLATGKRHKVIRSQYNIDIETVYPRYNKKLTPQNVNLIKQMIFDGCDNKTILNAFGYSKKKDNPSFYRYIMKIRNVQRLSKT